MRFAKSRLVGRQRPGSFPRTARASPFLYSPPALGSVEAWCTPRRAALSARLLMRETEGYRKPKRDTMIAALGVVSLSVRRSRLAALRAAPQPRCAGHKERHCTPLPCFSGREGEGLEGIDPSRDDPTSTPPPAGATRGVFGVVGACGTGRGRDRLCSAPTAFPATGYQKGGGEAAGSTANQQTRSEGLNSR